MIGRIWRGWADRAHADAYEALFKGEVRADLGGIAGYRGAYLLRREENETVEFVSLTLFDSLDAVRAFAGDAYETAVVLPEAQRLLRDYERTVRHYTVAAAPRDGQG